MSQIKRILPVLVIAWVLAAISTIYAATADPAKEKAAFFRYGELAEYQNHNWEDALLFYQKALDRDPGNRHQPDNGECLGKLAFGYLQLTRKLQLESNLRLKEHAPKGAARLVPSKVGKGESLTG